MTLSPLFDPIEVAQLLAGVERTDPRGIATPSDLVGMAYRHRAFLATAKGGQAVYVLEVRNGQAFIAACKGEGAVDWTGTLLPAIELQASELDSVAFQTSRRGLVKRAQQQGYEITGWTLRKQLRKAHA